MEDLCLELSDFLRTTTLLDYTALLQQPPLSPTMTQSVLSFCALSVAIYQLESVLCDSGGGESRN